MRLILCCAAAIALSACATPEPAVRTMTVNVPVPVSCLPAGGAPDVPSLMTGPQLAALGDYALVLELSAERDDLIGYAARADAVLRACR